MRKLAFVAGTAAMSLAVLCDGTQHAFAGSSQGSTSITIWQPAQNTHPAFEQLIMEFERIHPNIKVNLVKPAISQLKAQFQTAISSNSLPDIFLSAPYTVPQLVQFHQLHPLNSVLTKRVRSLFPSGTFSNGNTDLNGITYEVPVYSGLHGTPVMFYNKLILKKYGLGVPRTWTQMISEGKIIAAKSNGQSYGLALALSNGGLVTEVIGEMASTISPNVSVNATALRPFNFKTGHFEFLTPGILRTMKFFKTLWDDKIIDPDSMNLLNEQIAPLVPSGKSAFIITGEAVGDVIRKTPFSAFGATTLPTSNGHRGYLGYAGTPGGGFEVSAYTKHWPQVKLFLQYAMSHLYPLIAEMGTTEPAMPSAMYRVKPPYQQYRTVMRLMNETRIDTPIVYQRNSATISVIAAFEDSLPDKDLGTVLQGYLTGQVSNLSQALKQLTVEYNQTLNSAIQSSNGAVTENDFQFPNWVPFKSYTAKDYAKLKGSHKKN